MFHILITTVIRNEQPYYDVSYSVHDDNIKMPFGPIDKNMPWFTGDEADIGEHVASHLCRHGRMDNEGELVCINPWHIIFTTQKVNVDHNKCAYGSRSTCPHGV